MIRGKLDQEEQQLEVDYTIGRDIRDDAVEEISRVLQEWWVFFTVISVYELLTLRTLMSTTVDILRFYWYLYNQLLKVKCAFDFETLIYVGI